MPSADPTPPPMSDERSFDGISHGYAPDGPPVEPPPVPLEQIVGDVVDNLSATAKAEFALIEARGELALHGASRAAIWGGVAATAAGVALLALAFGAILALSPQIGPLLATLVVVSALLVIAALAAWRAHSHYGDIRTAFRSDLTNEGIDDGADA
ncbi:MAG: phage holin family protein [Alphaproteobacteria bacterium]|nr:phage holin family protein [Alphaproteobacteria bacterium]MBU0866369.1 phage holin family protein [Alphaproteobacteria bacterium]MBU1824306.1 phage holin family protein [Alphaproteobacteria bacterium]